MVRLPVNRHALVGLLAVLAAVLCAPLLTGDRAGAFVAGSATARAAQDDGGGRPADARFPLDGPSVAEARRIADEHWGGTPCNGKIEFRWGVLEAGTNATARWKNPTDAWNNAGENFDCEIELNARADYDWAKLCTVIAHEAGHLHGRRHAADDGSLMGPVYRRPLDRCAATRDPAAPAPPPRTAPAAPPAPPAGQIVTLRATQAAAGPTARAAVSRRASYGKAKTRKARHRRAVGRCAKPRRVTFSSKPRARRAAVRSARCGRTLVTLRKAR